MWTLPVSTSNLSNAYAQQWNLTVERELGARRAFDCPTSARRSTSLVYGRNINQPAPSTMAFNQNRRPFPLYRNIVMRENGGNQIYHALSTQIERKWQRGLSFMAAWTWAKNLTDVDETGGVEGGTTLENAFDRARERADAQYTPRHRFISTVIWELPFGSGKPFLSDGGLASGCVRRMAIERLLIAQTGEFLTPSFTGPIHQTRRSSAAFRIGLANGNLPSDQRTIDRWFDASAFVVPPANAGRFGNSGRGIIVGPGRQTASAALFKSFPIRERMFFRVQISFTNLFNHANFDIPALNISAPAAVGTIRAIQTRDLAGPRMGCSARDWTGRTPRVERRIHQAPSKFIRWAPFTCSGRAAEASASFDCAMLTTPCGCSSCFLHRSGHCRGTGGLQDDSRYVGGNGYF